MKSTKRHFTSKLIYLGTRGRPFDFNLLLSIHNTRHQNIHDLIQEAISSGNLASKAAEMLEDHVVSFIQ